MEKPRCEIDSVHETFRYSPKQTHKANHYKNHSPSTRRSLHLLPSYWDSLSGSLETLEGVRIADWLAEFQFFGHQILKVICMDTENGLWWAHHGSSQQGGLQVWSRHRCGKIEVMKFLHNEQRSCNKQNWSSAETCKKSFRSTWWKGRFFAHSVLTKFA